MATVESNTLDDGFLDFESIKKKLAQAGIHNYYITENNKLLVSENDAVRVEVDIVNNKPVTDKKFPQIGNTIQIIVTAVLAIVAYTLDLPFKWILAIGLGQLASYMYHTPKIKKLESEIKASIE